ncbi:Hypothetical protein SMAX5B_018574 [Scophthalmus maximus]|uniref:Uncharacterized protein n=1 Tax=Scophthalmus maximus TaxID=52904 RepID=A0A2U9C863_SCOMX|nr:Hypothetical protein SMAX5B_018574 [Scophthalmus maximus]
MDYKLGKECNCSVTLNGPESIQFTIMPTPEGNIWLSYELLHVCCLVPSGVANSRFLELETAVGCDASRAR